MKILTTILSLIIMGSSAFADNLEIGATQALSNASLESFSKNLKQKDLGGFYSCYRNLSNYGDDATLDNAARTSRTFIDQKRKDVYVLAYLTSTLVENGVPAGAILKRITKDEFVIEYSKDFKIFSRDQDFTEVKAAGSKEGVVQQVFRLENNRLVWVAANYDIQSSNDESIPQVRCARLVKTLNKGWLFDSNEYVQDPILDLDLRATMCRGNSTQCATILPEPMIAR